MIPLSHLFDYISKRQYEFQSGWQIVGQAAALFTFETFAMVLCSTVGIRGYPSLVIYIIVPITIVFAVTYAGHKMIKSGYAHKYQKYGMDVNVDWKDTVENVKTTRELVERINRRGIRKWRRR